MQTLGQFFEVIDAEQHWLPLVPCQLEGEGYLRNVAGAAGACRASRGRPLVAAAAISRERLPGIRVFSEKCGATDDAKGFGTQCVPNPWRSIGTTLPTISLWKSCAVKAKLL